MRVTCVWYWMGRALTSAAAILVAALHLAFVNTWSCHLSVGRYYSGRLLMCSIQTLVTTLASPLLAPVKPSR